MDNLRSAILRSHRLEAEQEVEDLLDRPGGTALALDALYGCATRHVDSSFTTPHGLILVFNLDRSLEALRRMGLATAAARHVAGFLAEARRAALSVGSIAAAAPDRDLLALARGGDGPGLAARILGLSAPDLESGVRSALLDLALAHLGRLGHTLIYLNAFLSAFQRSGVETRELLARAMAGYLAARVHEPGVSTAKADGPPPIPGDASAGELLAALRDFHIPRALAALAALVDGGRADEALTVLLLRAEENSSRLWHNFILADAARQCCGFANSEQRRAILLELAERLLHREPEVPIVGGLAAASDSPKPSRRERAAAAERLVDGIQRADPEVALTAARVALADADGADLVLHALFEASIRLPDPHAPHAFILVATAQATADFVGWPAARGPLLRAVYGLSAERNA